VSAAGLKWTWPGRPSLSREACHRMPRRTGAQIGIRAASSATEGYISIFQGTALTMQVICGLTTRGSGSGRD